MTWHDGVTALGFLVVAYWIGYRLTRVVYTRFVRPRLLAMYQQELRDFMKHFPGRCPVCSLYEYGLMHGLEEPGTRPIHNCQQVRQRLLETA